MKICLLEPFYAGSHARWAEEWQRKSRHSIDILSLPGRHWKWRMHGGAITLAEQYKAADIAYKALVASDMMDLPLLLSLLPKDSPTPPPTAVYFHENQLCYPWSPRDKDVQKGRDLHYGFINYASALVADKAYFNSQYHKIAFNDALDDFLKRYPDHRNEATLEAIEQKSSVLSLGMDLKAFDAHADAAKSAKEHPLILWNHRWEYDKQPMKFFKLLYAAQDKGLDFDVALLGEDFEEVPPYFEEAKERLGSRLIQYGHVDSFSEYAKWLWRADILPVTSNQDFFGGSVVEAMYCGCHPILPNRLAYPEHLDDRMKDNCLYNSEEEALAKLCALIESKEWTQPSGCRSAVERYDWSQLIERYDDELENLAVG